MLEQFVVLAEEKHFGRAARRLSMSQPPLSQAIQRLERGLGVALLERGTRSVRLTPAGVAFARDAEQLLDLHAAAAERARRTAAGLAGDLRIGFINSLGYEYLPTLLRWIAEDIPGLRAHLRQQSSAALTDQVRTRALDLAFVRAPLENTDGLRVHHVLTERLIAALPQENPLARRATVALGDLAEYPFAGVSPGALPGLAEQVRLACDEVGFVPRFHGCSDDLLGLLSYVASGVCVCLVPAQLRRHTMPGIRFVPLRDRSRYLETTIAAIHRADEADAAVRGVLDLITRRQAAE